MLIGTALQVNVTEVGTYTLIVTNTNNGCTTSASTSVQPDVNIPTPAVTQSGILTCDVQNVVLDGTSSTGNNPLTYQWEDAGQLIISTENNISVNTPGVFTLIVTDTNNGCTAEMTVEVLQDIAPPIADAGLGGTLDCNISQVPLNGANSSTGNNFTYQWLDENLTEISTAINTTASAIGTYTLVVTNNINGCTFKCTSSCR